jgi:transaldolase
MVKFNKIEIFADGADIKSIKSELKNKIIKGFTTNPSLMRKSGIKDYEKFCKRVAKLVYPKSISLEAFSDDLNEMYNQAKIISSWNKNIFVKIPITNSKGVSTNKIIEKLSNEKINLNITAIFTTKQVMSVFKILNKNSKTILSIFAGRIADSGRDPKITIKKSVKEFSTYFYDYKLKHVMEVDDKEETDAFEQCLHQDHYIYFIPYDSMVFSSPQGIYLRDNDHSRINLSDLLIRTSFIRMDEDVTKKYELPSKILLIKNTKKNTILFNQINQILNE